MKMTDYPERINISPVFRQKREDDFYLVDRAAFPDKGTEYVRADLHAALEAQLAEAKWALKAIANQDEGWLNRKKVVALAFATLAKLECDE